MNRAITLEEFTSRLGGVINTAPSVRGVWVTAETSDVRRSGHCYLELIQKHPLTGEPVARVRATIWRSALARIEADFMAATGSRLESGMKVMVLATASYHPAYGLSVNITGIDPSYTLGDLLRRRMEIVERLRREGILDLNKELGWPEPALRIAVVSAPGAAGYGDFINQLFTNRACLSFHVELFPAVMQGSSTVPSIISALEQIAAREDEWDGVVVIRGGGATSDLASFDSYDLAANIAQFPLPVIIGIGHERDVTVLDYVANMRVKTPTAAAEWLISRGTEALAYLDGLASGMVRSVTTILAGCREELAYASATLPHLPLTALSRASAIADRLSAALGDRASQKLRPEEARLALDSEKLSQAALQTIERQRVRLGSREELIEVLSPASTLRRGYSITRVGGHAVTSVASLQPGCVIETTLPDGTVKSTVQE